MQTDTRISQMEIADVQPVAPPPLWSSTPALPIPEKRPQKWGRAGRRVGLSGDYGPADLRSADMGHSEDRGGGKKHLKGRGSGRVHPLLSLWLYSVNNGEFQQSQNLLKEKKRKRPLLQRVCQSKLWMNCFRGFLFSV